MASVDAPSGARAPERTDAPSGESSALASLDPGLRVWADQILAQTTHNPVAFGVGKTDTGFGAGSDLDLHLMAFQPEDESLESVFRYLVQGRR